jgi:hypothetical protein
MKGIAPMESLVKLVQEKTGLNEEHATMAINTVVAFLKEKLPEPIAAQIDVALSGDIGGVVQQASGLLGGLFGGGEKKES